MGDVDEYAKVMQKRWDDSEAYVGEYRKEETPKNLAAFISSQLSAKGVELDQSECLEIIEAMENAGLIDVKLQSSFPYLRATNETNENKLGIS